MVGQRRLGHRTEPRRLRVTALAAITRLARLVRPASITATISICGIAATTSTTEIAANAIAANSIQAPGDLEIVEIMYNVAEGDDHDWLELVNRSGAEFDISGFEIDGIGLTLAEGTRIAPGVPVIVVADRAAFTSDHPGVDADAIIAEFDGRLADGGERLTIRDSAGAEVFSARYDDGDHWPVLGDGLGFSIEYGGDFSITGVALTPDHPLAWRASPVPGGTPASMPEPLPREPIVVVNEVIAATDPPYEDAIELYNPNESTIDVTGWFLSDDRSDLDALRSYSIPGILTGSSIRFPVIPPFGYLVLYESEFGDPSAKGNFRLNGDGEGVYLSAPHATLDGLAMVRGADFAASETNLSYGRHITSIGWDFAPLTSPTFGVIDPVSVDEFRHGAGAKNAAPTIGPLVIEEVLIDPLDPDVEFVELHNVTDSPIALWNTAALTSTYQLDDAISYFFGPDDVVSPGGRIVITVDDPVVFRAARDVPEDVPVVGPYTGGLNNAEDVLRLRRRLFDDMDVPGGWLPIDHLAYEAHAPWPIGAFGTGSSLQRIPEPLGYGNDPANWTVGVRGGSPGRDPEPVTPATPTATVDATASASPSPTTGGPLDTPTPTASSTSSTPTPLDYGFRIWLPWTNR